MRTSRSTVSYRIHIYKTGAGKHERQFHQWVERRPGWAISALGGQINAVRAAFKAGIKPSLIARHHIPIRCAQGVGD
jgi:hypothetical protein